eukprot:8425052-Pyramimonas_sp.AAC.1
MGFDVGRQVKSKDDGITIYTISEMKDFTTVLTAAPTDPPVRSKGGGTAAPVAQEVGNGALADDYQDHSFKQFLFCVGTRPPISWPNCCPTPVIRGSPRLSRSDVSARWG